MRFELHIQARRPFRISLNYQPYLAGAIYHLIHQASPDHATWLHDKGFTLGDKHFKHFTFSRLFFPERPVIQDGQILVDGHFHWVISVYAEMTLMQLIIGLFEKRTITIGQANNEARIKGVEILPEPVFSGKMKFVMLSPTLVKKPVFNENRGKLTARYLMPEDPETGDLLNRNLVNKYLSLHPEEKETDKSVQFFPDTDYIRRHEGRVSKLVTFKTGQNAETRLRAFECPFTLEGDPELIRIAYECGLGDNNAMGFGMIEVVNNGKTE